MKHTATPWRVGAPSQMGSVVADEPVPEIKGSDAVQYYGGHLIAESIAPRNAEFIVRACNAHVQLVVACDRALRHFETIRGDKDETPLMAELRRALRSALGGAA